jgi:hypothetical protein
MQHIGVEVNADVELESLESYLARAEVLANRIFARRCGASFAVGMALLVAA